MGCVCRGMACWLGLSGTPAEARAGLMGRPRFRGLESPMAIIVSKVFFSCPARAPRSQHVAAAGPARVVSQPTVVSKGIVRR